LARQAILSVRGTIQGDPLADVVLLLVTVRLLHTIDVALHSFDASFFLTVEDDPRDFRSASFLTSLPEVSFVEHIAFFIGAPAPRLRATLLHAISLVDSASTL